MYFMVWEFAKNEWYIMTSLYNLNTYLHVCVGTQFAKIKMPTIFSLTSIAIWLCTFYLNGRNFNSGAMNTY